MNVYKKWSVDVLESALIVNSIALTAVVSYTESTGNTRQSNAAIYTSTVIVSILLVSVVIYHIHRYILKGKVDIRKKLPKMMFSSKADGQVPLDSVIDDKLYANEATEGDRNASIFDIIGPPVDSDYEEPTEMRYRQPTFSVMPVLKECS